MPIMKKRVHEPNPRGLPAAAAAAPFSFFRPAFPALAAVVAAASLIAPLARAARAATRTVKPPASPSALPLQDALDRAQHGDTVLAEPGEYAEHHLRIPSGVTLRSRLGAKVTRLVGDRRGSIVQILDADSLTRVEGFTFTHGGGSIFPDSAGGGGGGAVLLYRSAARIRDNAFLE